MNPEIIAAIAAGVVTILGTFFGLIRWLTKTFLTELKPNGGNSLKDQVNSLKEQFNRIENRVDDIINILIQNNQKTTRRRKDG